MKSTSIMIIRNALFVVLFTFVCLPAFGEEKKVPDAAQEEARQILQELQCRFQNRPPYQLSFLTVYELLGGTEARISVNQDEKPVTYYMVDGLVRLSGEKIEFFYTDAHLNNDWQKGTEYHSVWQDGRGFELRKNLVSGREVAGTTRVKLHDKIRPDSIGWFADGVFIDSNHYSEDLLGVPELKIACETEIAGGELLRIEGEIPSGTMTVWLSVEKPSTLKRASFKASSNFVSQIDDINAFNLEVEVLEYTKIGDAPLPTKAVATYSYEIPSEPKRVKRLTTTRREIQVNPDFGSMNAFQIDFPEGMIVEDYDANVTYKWVRGELQVIEGEPIPLTGKALPELKNLGIDLSPADVNDKVILVCFFDMEQRPSRNCLRRLSEQALELKAKNTVIVAVQVSKIDGNTLSQWIKKNNIPFPVGMVQGNEANTRFAWGVRSLPWLILTDRQHIVRTVGFGISELSSGLEEANRPITKEEIERRRRTIAESEIERLGGSIVKACENDVNYTEVTLPRYGRQWTGGDWGARYLNDLVNLRKLRIYDVEAFTDEGMKHLKGLQSLEFLMLNRTGVSDEGLIHLKDLTKLEFLGLMSNKFTDAGLEHITGMTGLKSLRFDDARITDEGLGRLKQWGLLTRLEFLALNRTQITDAGLAYLQGMDRLRLLYLRGTRIGDEGISHLAKLSKMEGLILNNTNITDAGLVYMKGLRNLNMLYLNNTQITDAGLENLKESANLVQLWLGGTKITDAGLAHIQGLTSLQSVDLEGTAVTNKGLTYLKPLTALRELFLKQSNITIDGYMDLKGVLPDCQIYWVQKKGNDSA